MKRTIIISAIIIRNVLGLNLIAQQNNDDMKNLTFAKTDTKETIVTPIPANEVAIPEPTTFSGQVLGAKSLQKIIGLTFDGSYKSDFFSVVHGDVERGSDFCSLVDVKTTMDLEELVGLHGATCAIDVMKIGEGFPSQRTRVAQGVSNLESVNNFAIYTATFEQSFAQHVSVMVGLYDFCSDFYALQTSAAFINPAFGIGSDLSQTGTQGPSIYPYTSLGLRIKWAPTEHSYFLAAALDGVPGDPNTPTGTHILLNAHDGLFLAAESGYIAESAENTPYMKLGIGSWIYTSPFDDLVELNEDGSPMQRHSNYGGYILAERSFAVGTKEVIVFGRIGFANQHLNQFDYTYAGGFMFKDLLTEKDNIAIAFSTAHVGTIYSNLQGVSSMPSETVIEATYSIPINPWLTLQPDMQIFLNANNQTKLASPIVLGTRLSAAL